MGKNKDNVSHEIAIMKLLDHPNIIKLYEVFEDHRSIYLVMELCMGGELFDRIIDERRFSEAKAALVMQQIIRAVFYMHENHVCHRDLKPENFLFANREQIEHTTLKIIDFGLSCKFTPGTKMKTKAGTPYYVAPEVLEASYDHASDLWSCGVIMYILLCGSPPFSGDDDATILASVRAADLKFDRDWRRISLDAKDLIRRLLIVPVDRRCTASEALGHVWIKNHAPNSRENSLSQDTFRNLKAFRSQAKLKKAALHVIAGQMDDKKIKKLRQIFLSMDVNGDGFISLNELKEGLENASLDLPGDVCTLMEDLDTDGSGHIDYTEFLAATLDKRHYLKEEVCWRAFRVFDQNGDGRITVEELRKVLGSGAIDEVIDSKNCQALMAEVDGNGDGVIDFNEFMQMMRSQCA